MSKRRKWAIYIIALALVFTGVPFLVSADESFEKQDITDSVEWSETYYLLADEGWIDTGDSSLSEIEENNENETIIVGVKWSLQDEKAAIKDGQNFTFRCAEDLDEHYLTHAKVVTENNNEIGTLKLVEEYYIVSIEDVGAIDNHEELTYGFVSFTVDLALEDLEASGVNQLHNDKDPEESYEKEIGSLGSVAGRKKNLGPTGHPNDAAEYDQISLVKFIDCVSLYLGGAALDDQGGLWMWGYNAYGMQGKGIAESATGTARYQGGMKRVPYFALNNIKIIKIWGAYHTMYAQASDGTMYAWGRGAYGNMANGTTVDHNNAPVKMTMFPNDETVDEVFVGPESGHAAFAIMKSGNVYAWGRREDQRIPNSFLAVGAGTTTGVTGAAISIPQYVEPLTQLNKAETIVSMSIGDLHGVAVTGTGKAYSWGYNGSGRLGNGTTVNNYNVTQIPLFDGIGLKAVEVSANHAESLILTDEGDVYMFGPIKYAHSTGERAFVTPTKVEIDYTSADYEPFFTQVQAGRYAEFAIDQHGRIWTWGSNHYYQYGVDGPGWGPPGDDQPYNWQNVNNGKYNKYLQKATQIPQLLGDGDTEQRTSGSTSAYQTPVKGPVFSDLSSNQVNQLAYTLQNWRYQGMWSNYTDGDGKHPTIYDKKYYKTIGEFSHNDAYYDRGTRQAQSHNYVYFTDELGRKLVYVITREGTTAANFRYSGNFYVADDSYSGYWFVNRSGIADVGGYASTASSELPSGVTSETALPVVKDEEKSWIELSTGGNRNDFTGTQNALIPFAVDIFTYQSNMTLLDSAGNLFRTSLDGSGTIAWGWDYVPQYDFSGATHNYGSGTQARHKQDGLFDYYCYEIMFMRGAPTIDILSVGIEREKKVYASPDDEVDNQITITVDMPSSNYNEALESRIYSDLSDLKYVLVPYDKENQNFNRSPVSLTENEFLELYDSVEPHLKGDLVDSSIHSADEEQRLDFEVNLPINGKIFVYAKNQRYSSNDNGATKDYLREDDLYSALIIDNIYTLCSVRHKGVGTDSQNSLHDLYKPTDVNVFKINDDSKHTGTTFNKTLYGVPLDTNRSLIDEPFYGFDTVEINSFEAMNDVGLPGGIKPYWKWRNNQENSVRKTLDTSDYLIGFTHPFYYEQDSNYWTAINGWKEWVDENDRLGFRPSEITLTLKQYERNITTGQSGDYIQDISSVTFGANDDWRFDFGTHKSFEYTYDVVEELIPGYTTEIEYPHYAVSTGTNEDFSGIVVTNTLTLKPIKLYKVDSSNNPITSDVAVFTLANAEAGGNVFDGDGNEISSLEFSTSEAEPYIITPIQKPGTYLLTETKAPAGYNLLTKDIEITIDDQGQVEAKLGVVQLEEVELDIPEKDQYAKVFKIVNKAASELPKAGGIGTLALLIISSIILILAGLIWRKRKTKTNELI